MADDVTIKDAAGTNVVIATDDVGSGREVQQVKIDVGAGGATQLMDASHPVFTSQQGVVEQTKGIGKAATPTITRVGTSSGASATLLNSNTSRRGFII